MISTKPDKQEAGKVIYTAWRCPKCPQGKFVCEMATQKDIDEHLATHFKDKQEATECPPHKFVPIPIRTDTAGNEIKEIVICSYCQQDTAGNHEWNCPNNPNKVIKVGFYWGLNRAYNFCLKETEANL